MLNRLFHSRPAVPERTVTEVANDLEDLERAPQIVDVREPDEWRDGHVPGAVLIPLGELGNRLAELDQTRPIALICRSGNRSGSATAALLQAGYTNVVNVQGGMIAWAQAGLPIER